MIPGDVNDTGLWVVTAAEAAELPDGASVAALTDATGHRIERPPGALLKQEGGIWASKDPLHGRLEDGVTYVVVHPPRYHLHLDAAERAYGSREEFESEISGVSNAGVSYQGTPAVSVASCSHPASEPGVYTRVAS